MARRTQARDHLADRRHPAAAARCRFHHQEPDRQSGDARHSAGLRFPGFDGRLRRQFLADRGRPELEHRAPDPGRHAEHAAGCRHWHRGCYAPGVPGRRDAAVAKLPGVADRHRLRGNAAQRAAAGAAAVLVSRHQQAVSGRAPSHDLGDLFFLSNRGIYAPRPVAGDDFGLVLIALLVGIVAAGVITRWARRRQDGFGQQFHSFWVGLGIIVLLPLLVGLALGSPLSWEVPELKGFNFQGGSYPARACGLGARPQHVYRSFHRRDRAWRHHSGQPWPNRSVARSRPQAELDLAPCDRAAGAAGHHSAADQPIPQRREELDAGRHHRLPPSLLDHRHGAEPNRPRGRERRHPDGVLPQPQPADLAVHELVQPAHRAGRAIGGGDDGRYAHRPARRTAQAGPAAADQRGRPDRLAAGELVRLAVRHRVDGAGGGADLLHRSAAAGLAYFSATWTYPTEVVLGDRSASASDCAPGGACWLFVRARYEQFIFGFYPEAERWRVILSFVLGAAGIYGLLGGPERYRRYAAYLFFIAFPIVSFWLLRGDGVVLPSVTTDQWGGFMLTLVIALVGIVLSLPIGIRSGARPKVQAADHPYAVCDLHRVRARRAADHRHLHGQPDGAAVPAARHGRQCAVARPGRHHGVRVRLHGGGRARRLAGDFPRASSRAPWRSGSAIGR